jgi:putative addiction module killer protein
MPEVRQTQQFRTWLRRLKDSNAVARIVARIRRMEQGNFGDTRSVGAGVMELRITMDLDIASTMSIVEPKS